MTNVSNSKVLEKMICSKLQERDQNSTVGCYFEFLNHKTSTFNLSKPNHDIFRHLEG